MPGFVSVPIYLDGTAGTGSDVHVHREIEIRVSLLGGNVADSVLGHPMDIYDVVPL